MINHKRYLSWENYSAIDEERDLGSWVINLRVLHAKTTKEAKALDKITSKLQDIIPQRDYCQDRWNEIQIRTSSKKITKVYRTLMKVFKKRGVTYQMVIVNCIKNSKQPVGRTMCDGLLEAGELRDRYQKERTDSYCLFYDRKIKQKAWIKAKDK